MELNKPNMIILHCAQTPDKDDRFGAEDINKWHKERGFEDEQTGIHCGYHYVIRRSGIAESYSCEHPCRPELSIGAHCRGHNTNSLGVVFMMTKVMTAMQMESWMNLYRAINTRWTIPLGRVFGHYEFNDKKTCPNFNVQILRLSMRRELTR